MSFSFHFDIDNRWTLEISWHNLRLKHFAFILDRWTATVMLWRQLSHLMMVRVDAVWWIVGHSFDFHFVFGQQIAWCQCVVWRWDRTVCSRCVHFHWLALRHTHIRLQVVCDTSIIQWSVWRAVGENWWWNLTGERTRWQWWRLITVHLRNGSIHRWWRVLRMACDRLMQSSSQITQFWNSIEIEINFINLMSKFVVKLIWSRNLFCGLTVAGILDNCVIGGVVVCCAAVVIVACIGIFRAPWSSSIVVYVFASLWLTFARLKGETLNLLKNSDFFFIFYIK